MRPTENCVGCLREQGWTISWHSCKVSGGCFKLWLKRKMSGHSKWAQIKRQKAVVDARRGQLFTKLSREITVAVREGGRDPDLNRRLRLAIERAKDNNMPQDVIERAIKRGTGELEGATLVEANYEGYSPGGAAILLQVLTDNPNRTVAEIRHLFERAGGSLGEKGCVSWLFETKGVINLDPAGNDPEELALLAIDAGAEDVKVEDEVVEVYTRPEDLERVHRELAERGLRVSLAEISLIPQNYVRLDEKVALQALRLLEKLEEVDGVQRVFTNADFPNEVLQAAR